METIDWIQVAQDNDQWRTLVENNELLVYIKGEEFLEYMSDYQLLKKDCAACSSLCTIPS
jgi:hypothetical protein